MKKVFLFVVFVFVFVMSGCSSNDIDKTDYKEITSINGYDIYFTSTATCIEELQVTDATVWITYEYSCTSKINTNVYIAIKDNEQYDLLE